MLRETPFGDVEHVKDPASPGEVTSPGRTDGRGRNVCGELLVTVNGMSGIPPVAVGRLADALTRPRTSSADTPALRWER